MNQEMTDRFVVTKITTTKIIVQSHCVHKQT